MNHPLKQLYADMLKDNPSNPPFGIPPAPAAFIEQLIAYTAAHHLTITVSTDTASKRAALLKARDDLDAQIAAITPDGVAEHSYENAVCTYQRAHGTLPVERQQIGIYPNGKPMYYGDY